MRIFVSMTLGLAICSMAQDLRADTLLVGDHSISGELCVGQACTDSEPDVPYNTLQLKAVNTAIFFNDTSSVGGGVPTTNWRLLANEASSTGRPSFSIENEDRGSEILKLEALAPASSIYVTDAGWIGLGTSMPIRNLHLAAGDLPGIRIEQKGFLMPPYAWDIGANHIGFFLSDAGNAGISPFMVRAGSPVDSFYLDEDGAIGLGTDAPAEALHLLRDNGHAMAFVEETSAITNPRSLLNLRNNGRPEIVMGNTDTDGEWSLGAGTNFIMKFGAVGSRSPAKTKHLTLFSGSGDLKITGQIITGGPSCAGGCDAVFSDDYDLATIDEHEGRMKALGHLPAIGPTTPHAPLNVSETLGGVLNELEHAHLYIAELNRQNRALSARLERLEAAQNN